MVSSSDRFFKKNFRFMKEPDIVAIKIEIIKAIREELEKKVLTVSSSNLGEVVLWEDITDSLIKILYKDL